MDSIKKMKVHVKGACIEVTNRALVARQIFSIDAFSANYRARPILNDVRRWLPTLGNQLSE